MTPWECPRCHRINAAWSAQCTCTTPIENPRKTLHIVCTACGKPWAAHRVAGFMGMEPECPP